MKIAGKKIDPLMYHKLLTEDTINKLSKAFGANTMI